VLRGIIGSVALAALVSFIALLLFAATGFNFALRGPPSPAGLERLRLLFGMLFIAVVAFDVTIVFGGIFEWRHTGRVAWFLLAVALLSVVAAIVTVS